MNFFELRGRYSDKKSTLIGFIGFVIIISIWWLISYLKLIPNSILPNPINVIISLKELHFDNALIRNIFFSVKLNLLGYIEAIIISIPIGFLIGLNGFSKSLLSRYVNSFRFIPLTAVTGLFIAWFGIGNAMKVQFLAFGIIVYLIPVIIQRIEDVDSIYVDTLHSLGASKTQQIFKVFVPDVLSKLSDDIRVLVAISWTYIIVAELINKTGGIGSLIYISARQSRIDKVFALLLIIICIGFIQDKLFNLINKTIFPFKYVQQGDKK